MEKQEWQHEWQHHAITLARTKLMSWREIAQVLDKPKSTISDFLRKYESVLETPEQVRQEVEGVTHLVIPDTQTKDGVNLDYLEWIGKYIVRKRPDVIVHLGDHADMESLSSYDKGKKTAEGKRVFKDIAASKEGMRRLLAPLRELQEQQRAAGEPVYNPRRIILYGNHEFRIVRHVDANPELAGFLSLDSLGYEEDGWETVPFLTPIIVNGVAYSHYFPNVMTGKPLGGSALNMLKTIGTSFTMGHKQTLDVVTRFLPTDGTQQWGIIAGACYTHDEDYKGVQGNRHWRGVICKHNVRNGSYDPLFVSLDWLRSEYGND